MAVTAPAVLAESSRLRFEDLYAEHQPRVFRTCLAILRNQDDAAEATQEVFSRALPLLTQLREPQVWLTTVARNYCFDQLRRQKVRGPGAVLDEETPGSLRDDPERETMLRDALRQAFEALSSRERRALARVLLMDDSLTDIAAMLGVSYGAAAQVVSRARRRAALAARAVIGASLGWLVRSSMPDQRSRAMRLAAQALESGQNVLIAAVVVFGAGGLTHAEALAPASVGTPAVVHAVPAAATVAPIAVPHAAPALPAPPKASLPAPPLPPGYVNGRISAIRSGSSPDTPDNQQQTSPSVVTVNYPGVQNGCVVGGATVAPNGQTLVNQQVHSCAP